MYVDDEDDEKIASKYYDDDDEEKCEHEIGKGLVLGWQKSTWKYTIQYDYDHEKYNDDDKCEYHNEDKYDD